MADWPRCGARPVCSSREVLTGNSSAFQARLGLIDVKSRLGQQAMCHVGVNFELDAIYTRVSRFDLRRLKRQHGKGQSSCRTEQRPVDESMEQTSEATARAGLCGMCMQPLCKSLLVLAPKKCCSSTSQVYTSSFAMVFCRYDLSVGDATGCCRDSYLAAAQARRRIARANASRHGAFVLRSVLPSSARLGHSTAQDAQKRGFALERKLRLN